MRLWETWLVLLFAALVGGGSIPSGVADVMLEEEEDNRLESRIVHGEEASNGANMIE